MKVAVDMVLSSVNQQWRADITSIRMMEFVFPPVIIGWAIDRN
jgi:hypothetical protein